MNQEKAREFFSNYYEGTLEPGLIQSLEQAMARDSGLRDDYQLFETTYEELGNLKFETIEVPFDLNERISARVDKHLYDQRTKRQPSWTLWLRNTAIGTVAAVAVLGAILSLNRNGATAQAGLGIDTIAASKDQVEVTALPNGSVRLHFAPEQSRTLVIREGLGGAERRSITLEKEELNTKLENTKPAPAAFAIEVSGDSRQTIIALPGTDRSVSKIGEGNLEGFAKALASHYGIPVQVTVKSPDINLSWNLVAEDPETAASSTLDSQRFSIDRRASGLLVISDPDAFK